MKAPQRTIWIVRHGERLDNIDPQWKKNAIKWDDSPLSDRGLIQAAEVGTRLADQKIDHVFCSPFTRCVQTTNEIIKKRNDPVSIYIEPGLGESLNVCMNPPGSPPMSRIKELSKFVNDDYKPVFHTLPEENGQDEGCINRITLTVNKIIERYPTGNLLFVSHGSPIAAIHFALIGTWNYVGQCTIGKIIEENRSFSCEFYGTKDHLSVQKDLHEIQTRRKAPLYNLVL